MAAKFNTPGWLRPDSVFRQTLRRIYDTFLSIFASLGSLFWAIVCYGYILMWSIRSPVTEALEASGTVFITVSALWFIVEFVLTMFHVPLIHLEVALWLKLVILAVAILLIRHHWIGFKAMQRRPVFLTTTRLLLPEAAAPTALTAPDRKRQLDQFVIKVLVGFEEVFRGLKDLKLNVMLPDNDGNLRVAYCVPEQPASPYGEDFTLSPGEGGAGVAFSSQKTVYIPAIRYRQGIMVTLPSTPQTKQQRFELASDVYASRAEEPFKSVLSAPILSSQKACLGVLNVDCNVSNPFRELDFQVAEVAAAFVGMALDRFRGTP